MLRAATEALDKATGSRRAACGAAALAALSLAITIENLPFIVALAAAFGLAWIARGAAARPGLAAFGLTLALAGLATFAATVPPGRYGLVVCDNYRRALCRSGRNGRRRAALLAALSPRLAAPGPRALAAAVAAAGVGLVLAWLFPACLHDPLAGVDPLLRQYWLANVLEPARSPASRDDPATFAAIVLPIAFGLGWTLLACRAGGWLASPWMPSLLFVLAGCAGAMWQVRVLPPLAILVVPALPSAPRGSSNGCGDGRRRGATRWRAWRSAAAPDARLEPGAGRLPERRQGHRGDDRRHARLPAAANVERPCGAASGAGAAPMSWARTFSSTRRTACWRRPTTATTTATGQPSTSSSARRKRARASPRATRSDLRRDLHGADGSGAVCPPVPGRPRRRTGARPGAAWLEPVPVSGSTVKISRPALTAHASATGGGDNRPVNSAKFARRPISPPASSWMSATSRKASCAPRGRAARMSTSCRRRCSCASTWPGSSALGDEVKARLRRLAGRRLTLTASW